ncbi:electron transfer flavoprotein subunit alpha/FixB family protein [Actinotalea sp. M2MS4P-6]|uniref:electron transfer flavoprotein subunit alpha/FixB family protein n=1 Tax=Actinotalea sp. M2MS4P-6 TaxID=2983762 RepID=UPI0021E38097|nr:electron transfer flavoprotein subunit alpha/FixB family protein [Actinotalea sp. M2MS4P-6]MCV2394058.1 electron transfer flavoprotein subunit alpha/FixB family protein [Actinotalea sp. M2MS4P-6]
MTTDVLVLLEHADDGALRPSVPELLTLGRTIGTVGAVWVAAADPGADVLAELAAHGVQELHVVTPDAHPRLTPVIAEALAALVEPSTRAVLLGSSFENKEVAARLGVLTGAGVMVDVAALSVDGERLVAEKQVFAATWTTRCTVRTPLAVLAVKPHAVQAETTGPSEPQVVRHEVSVSAVAAAVEVVERTERAPSERPDLGAAQVVVVGGRGTDGDFSALDELADVLGGAVGATRVATDEGWIDRDAQIGQTGVTVAPRLYIGAGVSGAVHHRGGMQASGTIVAINTDADAPIFEIADLGIVGDLRQVLPQATAELRRLRG